MKYNEKTLIDKAVRENEPAPESHSGFRPRYGWLFISFVIVVMLEVIGYAGLFFFSNGNLYADRDHLKIRQMLMGGNNGAFVAKYISQPYHTYLPNPGYTSGGFIQHNAFGYRGTEIPLAKTNKYRILCLGGSTTYGTGVTDPSRTYPAQLDEILNGWHQTGKLQLAEGGVEVLNAGLEAGNSAEELMQYLLKYRYYQPDLVIIHSGGNDAIIDPLAPGFQPDYTHYRRLLFHLEPLPVPTRWMLHSHFISFLTIQLFFREFNKESNYFNHFGNQRYVYWMDNRLDSLYLKRDFTYYPFYQNHLTLIQSVKNEGSKLINLSFALDYNAQFVKDDPKYKELVELNNEIIETISVLEQVPYLPFHYDSIPYPDLWMDDCHLTEDGERLKAEMLARKIIFTNE